MTTAASSSPSPGELYNAMRTTGLPASATSVLDLYCATSRGGASGANGCHGDMSPSSCCSPDVVSPNAGPIDLQTINSRSVGSGTIDAATLRMMFGSGRQLPPPGGLASLPAGIGSSMNGQPPTTHRLHPNIDSSAFYLPPNLQMAAEMASSDAWNGLYNSAMGLAPYDARAVAEYQSYLHCYGGLHDVRRKNATRESTSTLKSWLIQHIKNPYPTKGEKIMLAIITKMTLTQVSTWFANARRRLKKENKMQWSPRQRTGDDDDDDVDDDDSPNDVMNGSFGVSDDECSNDVIVNDRGFSRSRSPRSHADNSDDRNLSFDLRVTSSDIDSHRFPVDRALTPYTRSHVLDDRDQLVHSPSSSSLTEDSRRSSGAPDRNAVASDDDVILPSSSKPRIWSIAELATSDNSRRKCNSLATSGSAQYQPMTSSSSPSPLITSHCSDASDFRPWAAVAPGSDDVVPMLYRKHFSDRLASSSATAAGGSQISFPVAAVEALRWQMAAAACRAAAVSCSSSQRFDGAIPNGTAADGGCSTGTRPVSVLR